MDVNINCTDRILVIAPHADDESIGCGGLLAVYGPQCDIMLLTDGRKGHTTDKYQDENELIRIRKEEFIKAGKIANVNNIIFLDIIDGEVSTQKNKIYEKVSLKDYDYVFVPNRYESHLDHRAVYPIFKRLKQKQNSYTKIYEYEVWTPLRHPTWFLDITAVSDKKKRMISQHVSQIADIDYATKGMALSCYRGAFNNCEFAEAYAFSEYSSLKKAIYLLLPESIKLKIRGIIK